MNKQMFSIASYFAVGFSVGMAFYLWLNQAFSMPLGLLAIVLMLAALWLQGESK